MNQAVALLRSARTQADVLKKAGELAPPVPAGAKAGSPDTGGAQGDDAPSGS